MIIPSWKLGTTEIRNNSKHPAQCQIKLLRKKKSPMHIFLFTWTFLQPESISAPLRDWLQSILCDIYKYGAWVTWNNSSKPHITILQRQYQNHILYCSGFFYSKPRKFAFNGLSVFSRRHLFVMRKYLSIAGLWFLQ